MTVDQIIAGVNAFNTFAPQVATLILSMKKSDGTEVVLVHLDHTLEQTEANIKEAQDWLAAHT